MHPFGGTPICPRCEKFVYAAEQVMGPGRKLYHKPCLACSLCNKRLDSLTLLEHDELPYCKSCHMKNFGTRDLRHANLPYRPAPPSPPASPTRTAPSPFSLRAINTGNKPSESSPAPLRPYNTGIGSTNGGNILLRPNRTLTSPTTPFFSRSTPTPTEDEVPGSNTIFEEDETEIDNPPAATTEQEKFEICPTGENSPFPSNTGRPGLGALPRTVPLTANSCQPGHQTSQSLGALPSSNTSNATFMDMHGATPLRQTATGTGSGSSLPLKPNATGTRYGVALMGGGNPAMASPARKWGGTTPVCPRCNKSVYFAEQVKAIGKTYHKNCLRCTECNTLLDSNRLRDHDSDPFCVRCYSRLHGPQGGGYALLGKAGG